MLSAVSCCKTLQHLIIHIILLMILFLPSEPSKGLYLEAKLIPPICFHLSFVHRQGSQTIHKQKSDKKTNNRHKTHLFSKECNSSWWVENMEDTIRRKHTQSVILVTRFVSCTYLTVVSLRVCTPFSALPFWHSVAKTEKAFHVPLSF